MASALFRMICVIVLGALADLAGAEIPIPEGWPRTAPPGAVRIAGADRAIDLLRALDDRLQHRNPGLRVIPDLRGVKHGLAALAAGSVDAVVIAREPTAEEVATLSNAWGGVPPWVQPAARFALEIRVHPANPVVRRGLTLAEVDAIFGSERRRGHPTGVTTWGHVGGMDAWMARPVHAYGSPVVSPLVGQIRTLVLGDGSLADTVREQPSGPVLAAVAADPNGICITWRQAAADPGTVPVPLVAQPHGTPADPDPLTGTLWVLLRPSELGAPPPALRAWLDLLWSRPGQELVTAGHLLPLDGMTVMTARAASHLDATGQVDPSLPRYVPGPLIPVLLRSMGSDVLNNLMTMWAETFVHHHPGALVEIEGKGGGTAFGSMWGDYRQFGPVTRRFTDEQIEQLRTRHGTEPKALRVAQDLLTVIVHPDNPIAARGMTLAQVDAAFSAAGRRGAGVAATWGDLGLSGTWAARPVVRVGRNAASGAYGWFRQAVLDGGDVHRDFLERPGSSAVVGTVAADPAAIGYCGIGYAQDPGVRIVPIAVGPGHPFIVPDPALADPQTYPLHRYLSVYVHPRPDPAAKPVMEAFLRLIASREGQVMVLRDGYMPMPWAILRKDLAALGIPP